MSSATFLNSSSSSTNSSHTHWDVFLSFHGKDTRFKFTSHLYAALDRHGIRTFMDDPELRSGQVISDALLQAIHGSKTYIVVFSENYASSRWCLDELVEILSCYKSTGALVLPVFYNIDPSIVRHQTQSYKKAFEMHETRFEGEKVKLDKWRLALTEVASFSGKHISESRSEVDVITEIVDEIMLEINPKTLDVAKYPVGLDSRVKDIATLLGSGREGVTRIGIYGMGGVGKTTLAKALYNQLLPGGFKGSCFLANVREVSSTTKGLVSLQQQLIDDVLKSKSFVKVHNVDQGTKLIEERLRSLKVLVVIDDLDHHKQFESLIKPFSSGSVIIITTRDEEILETIEIDPKYRYMAKELDDAESLTLFARHAFGNAKPEDKLMELSKDILNHAGGLPLALEVFGSYLYKRPEVGWKYFIEKLHRIPHSSIQQRLIISLDALESDDPMLKQIFLDIACFFIGWEKKDVVNILETFYSYTDYNIDILRKRCLLTVNNKAELRMHDLLRGVGREIACNNSHDEPGKHSRLWESHIICDVLKNHKGTEAIEVIIPQNYNYQDSLEGVSFATETFKRMTKLRFLHLYRVNLTGSFEHTFGDLRWLSWDFCPLKCLPSEFYPQNLVRLDLPCSDMTKMWEVMDSQVFEKLKTLNMSYSLELVTTPDFSKLPYLETLNFKGCRSLEEVHISIGSLLRLVSLNLGGCVNLRSLQDSICNLQALKSLNIDGCISLKALPQDLGKIESLEYLDAEELTISRIPDSIGRLSKLVRLSLRNNKNLKTLPDTLCNLRALGVLGIGNCSSLEALPAEIGNIETLKELHAYGLTVSTLPDSIRRLSKLVELTLSNCRNLKSLPDSICNLRALEGLGIGNCHNLEALPIEIGNLESLKELSAWGLTVLKLPDSIGHLSKLVELSLHNSKNLVTLPDTICNLKSLKNLVLKYCGHLLSIPKLPPNLKCIRADGCTSLQRLPNLSNLKQLEVLNLTNCRSLTCIMGLEELASLREVHLEGCISSLTSGLIQTYSGFGHKINIYLQSMPGNKMQPSNSRSVMCLEIHGSHQRFKMDYPVIDDYDNTAVNLEEEISYPSKRVKHLEIHEN